MPYLLQAAILSSNATGKLVLDVRMVVPKVSSAFQESPPSDAGRGMRRPAYGPIRRALIVFFALPIFCWRSIPEKGVWSH